MGLVGYSLIFEKKSWVKNRATYKNIFFVLLIKLIVPQFFVPFIFKYVLKIVVG